MSNLDTPIGGDWTPENDVRRRQDAWWGNCDEFALDEFTRKRIMDTARDCGIVVVRAKCVRTMYSTGLRVWDADGILWDAYAGQDAPGDSVTFSNPR